MKFPPPIIQEEIWFSYVVKTTRCVTQNKMDGEV